MYIPRKNVHDSLKQRALFSTILHIRVHIVYNSRMDYRKRYSKKIISREQFLRMRQVFLKKAGPSMQLLMDLMDAIPNVSLCVKNAAGRIMHVNRYNADISGWRSVDDMLGYTSEELYPPDQAAVYANRDREVLETGVPIIERLYGFVADRSPNLNCVTVRPVISLDGKRIGTANIYWRAQQKMKIANWYNPIQKAIIYLDDHYAENITVEQLANISHYSVAQFRRLFHVLMQMSPSDYISTVRINTAKTLLATTNKRIGDIAAEVGFFDHAHFIRTFKRLTGLTPAKYRKHRTHDSAP